MHNLTSSAFTAQSDFDQPMQSGRPKTSENIRSFVCIEVPEHVRLRIADLQEHLRGERARISWVKPSNIHVTIKFLGDVRSSSIPEVTEGISKSAIGVGRFEIEVSGTGCFPSPRDPRVLWVGLATIPDELRRLRDALETELAQQGFERESKNFAPHLTIGRVRSPGGAAAVARKLLSAGFEPERFEVAQLVLMRSDLNPTGSVYIPQAVIPLGGGGAPAER
jgi:2'-5' RNA ligase